MAKKVATKEKETEEKKVVKTYQLFLDLMKEEMVEGVDHEFVRCFPGRIVVLDDKGTGWFKNIQHYKNRDGMVYVTKVLGEVRLAVILTDGSYLITALGGYRNEYDWHIMNNDDGYMVIEETNLWEDAFCAELTWRMWWEEYREQAKAQEVWNAFGAELLRRLFGSQQ